MRTRSRGMTLIELMIAMVVTLVVVAGAVVAAGAQQRAYVDGKRLRDAQATGRRALLAFERLVPSAGFGVDPALAFDFNGWTSRPCPAAMGSCPVDSTSGPDELVFLARDPWYWITNDAADEPAGNAWRISAVDSASVTVLARAGDVFRKGQIFSAVCYGSQAYTYFTADATKTATASAALSIPLKPVDTANPFRRQDVAVLPPAKTENCFNPNAAGLASTPPRLFLVHRYRLHVHPAAVGTTGTATRYDPLLLLDRGVDLNGDDAVDEADEELLAEGVESFQVAYGFFSTSLPAVGATSGTGIAFAAAANLPVSTAAGSITTTLFPGTLAPGQTSPYQPSSFYSYGVNGPPSDGSTWARSGNHQGNVQHVRIAVLARSLDPDLQRFSSAAQHLPLYNQATAPAWVTAAADAVGGHDGYQRVVFETSIVLQNMAFRAMTYF